MDKASSATAPHSVAPVADSHTQSPAGPEEEEAAQRAAVCLRVAAAALVGCNLAAAAWRARHDPRDLAFLVGACALLAALLACLRRAERLTPGSPAEERRRVQAAVWVLCSVLSCAFAYRVAAIMPPALAVVVWCVTAFVVLAGFCLLLLCKHQQYKALGDADDAAGDTKAYVKIVGPTDV